LREWSLSSRCSSRQKPSTAPSGVRAMCVRACRLRTVRVLALAGPPPRLTARPSVPLTQDQGYEGEVEAVLLSTGVAHAHHLRRCRRRRCLSTYMHAAIPALICERVGTLLLERGRERGRDVREGRRGGTDEGSKIGWARGRERGRGTSGLRASVHVSQVLLCLQTARWCGV
jgi:hypothetical protein